MASDARRWRSFVPSAHVACRAIQGRVHPRQGEARNPQVIELRSQPRINRVALLALGREAAGHVVRSRRLLKRALVAGVALDRQALKLSDGFTLVAVGAIQARMPSDQREAVVMFLRPLQDDIPTLDRMALFAVRAHLATMQIGVAVRAVHTGVGKHRLGVTLRTTHSHM